MSGLIGSAGGGASVDAAQGAEEAGGGDGGSITLVESTDGTVDVTGGAGPVVNLSVGGVKTIESTDGSVTVTGGTGPTTNLSVDRTPGIVGKFTGMIVAAEGDSFAFLADPGQQQALAEGVIETSPQLYPTGQRTIATLRVVATNGNGATPYTVTLYKNGAATAQTVTVPAAAAVGAELTDIGHPIAFVNGDKYDVRVFKAHSADSAALMSVTLEGPGTGTGAGIAGFSWLSTQLGRAAATAPGLDSPWFTDLIVNPGQNNANQGIEVSGLTTGSGSVTHVTTAPGGVFLLATGATANSGSSLTSPNSNQQILQNPQSGAFYIVNRCKLVPGLNGDSNHQPVRCLNVANNGGIVFSVAETAGVPGYFLGIFTNSGSTTVGPSALAVDFNAHDFAVGFDGTTVRAYIDGVPVSTLAIAALTFLPADTLDIEAAVFNTATAADQEMYVDKLCCIQRSMQ